MPVKRLLLIAWLAILLLAWPSHALAEESPPAAERAQADATWLVQDVQSPVFRLIAADHKGHLYTLDPETFTVHSFDDKGRAREPVELQFTDRPGGVFSFDVNATGRVWALADLGRIYLFQNDGRFIRSLKPADPPAQVFDIALTRMGSAAYMNRRFWDGLDNSGHSLVGRIDEEGHESDVAFDLAESEEADLADSFRRLMLLDVADDGRLWAVERGRYEIWEMTPAGRKLTHLRLGDVELDFTSGTTEAPKRSFDATNPDEPAGPATTHRLVSAVRDFDTHGGLLWLLVRRSAGDPQQLEVVDPTLGTAHVVPLPKLSSPYQSVAASDRYVVLATKDADQFTTIDRAELLYQLSEGEQEPIELAREAADPDDPLAEVEVAETEESRDSVPVNAPEGQETEDGGSGGQI